MIRLIKELHLILDLIHLSTLAYRKKRLERRIQEEEVRIQREQEKIDHLEDCLKRLRQAEKAEKN